MELVSAVFNDTELVLAVFNDTEVHFMRGMIRTFKKPVHNGRELHTTYTCDAGEWTRLDPTTGERRAVYWKNLWPDFTGISGPTPSRLSRQFFGFELHRKGTPEELRSAALALIKSIDEELRKVPKPDGLRSLYAHYVRALAGGQWELTACDGSVAPMGISNVAGCPRCSALIIAPEPNKGSWEVARVAKPASPPPDANCVTRPDGECVSERPCMHSAPASPPCPGCGKPKRDCLELPPRYAGCTAWRAPAPEGAKVEHTASRLDGVVGFQLRPPPQELVVLVDDQSEPP